MTISTPLFVMWAWAGLGPHAEGAPEHDIHQLPCLYWRISFHRRPSAQVLDSPCMRVRQC